jgi:hypothetical protein
MNEDELRELLPARDVEFLIEKGWPDRIDVSRVGPEIHVRFKSYVLPSGRYNPSAADLLVRLIPPYPNENPDMFWTWPQVKLANGRIPDRAEVMQVPVPSGLEQAYQNANWQRWSRHFNDKSSWRPGIDGLRTYTASIRLELERAR